MRTNHILYISQENARHHPILDGAWHLSFLSEDVLFLDKGKAFEILAISAGFCPILQALYIVYLFVGGTNTALFFTSYKPFGVNLINGKCVPGRNNKVKAGS